MADVGYYSLKTAKKEKANKHAGFLSVRLSTQTVQYCYSRTLLVSAIAISTPVTATSAASITISTSAATIATVASFAGLVDNNLTTTKGSTV